MNLLAGAIDFDRLEAPEFDAIRFDGRLDNRKELMNRLRDASPGGTSDAALALAAYRKWGGEGFLHLIGDWSLALWDERERALVLASDFAGVRPLYYCVQGARVFFSAHLGALAEQIQASLLDDSFVAGFLVSGGCPNRSPYRGIYSVPPGRSVRFTRDHVTIQAFWKPPAGKSIRYNREREYEEHVRELFREAVACRLQTSESVMAELSGGLDSSSIVCMASELIRRAEVPAPRLLTLSVEHRGSLDERFYNLVAEFCGVDNIIIASVDHPFLTESSPGGAMPEFWERMHTHCASVVQNAGVKTFLTGRPGDLVMGNWGDDSDQVAGLLSEWRIGAALKESLAWSKMLRIPIYWVIGRAFLLSLPPALAPKRLHQGMEISHVPSDRRDSIAPAFRQRVEAPSVSKDWIHAPPERRKHFRCLAEVLECRKLQPPEAMQDFDYTHPYAHRPLVEFLYSIPASLLCGPGEPRRLMRRAFQELWPPQLRTRRSKDSFASVFLESLRPLAMMLLKESSLEVVDRGYVEAESFKQRLERLVQSLDCNEAQLRLIILLEVWLRKMRDRFKSPISDPRFH